MKRRIASAVAAVLLLGLGAFALAWNITERDMQRVIEVDDPSIADLVADADRARGEHLYVTRGCADCHGEDGRGRHLFDAGPVMSIVPSNITPAGLGDRYDADALAAAIRHGVRADGRPLIFMPSTDWDELSDDDTAALVAYVLALPPVEHDPGVTEVRPLGRILHVVGALALLPAYDIDHTPRRRSAPKPAATPQYGFYLAQTCTGCHGFDFAGRKVGPPDAPRASDLRRGAAMAGWSEQDFIRAMREGRRPDGSDIDPFMPWPSLRRMSDVELGALWRYFETLPAAQ